jgi:glycine betaine/proline transport system permease protein
MTTLTREPEAAENPVESPPPETRSGPRIPRIWLAAGVIVVWVILSIVFHGKKTLEIGGADQIGVQNWIGARANDLVVADTGNYLLRLTSGIADLLDAIIQWFQLLISVPAFPWPYPEIGFLGVLAVAWFFTALVAGWRMSIFTAVCFALFSLLGFYEDSMDLLIVTGVSVGLSVVVGLPLAVLMAHSGRARAIFTPVLDVMQTLPSFAYLLPLMLLFGIGAPAAVICTVIYSLPPVMRISSHGLRNLSESALEATDSMGQTGWQRLTKVELPMAKRTIIVGINQTTMAALSMATIAAFINGPGLGQPVVRALNALRVGDAFVPGICIVLMAIMLDRVTTAASEHGEKLRRNQAQDMAARRNLFLLLGAAVTIACVYMSRHYVFAAKPWESSLGDKLSEAVQTGIDWISDNWSGATSSVSDGFTAAIINKLEYVLAGSPWFVTALGILAIALIVGGWRAGVATVICLAGIRYLELWNNAMITLTSVLVAALFVMILAAVIGVWMGRSRGADRAIRPILDAGQTMPPFVYLIPVLALFGPTRFTAIVAAVAYAAPAAIKIVADGIKAVSAATVEAAESAGALTIQIITKVQVPMARSAFTVATNQGLLYVLAMVVIGGLVGAGALGYDVVAGFKQLDTRGRGLAAGFSIVLLGVMLDRITTYAARRGESRSS